MVCLEFFFQSFAGATCSEYVLAHGLIWIKSQYHYNQTEYFWFLYKTFAFNVTGGYDSACNMN